MSWTSAYLIIVSCVAFQGIVRDLIKLRSKLKERSGRKGRAVDIDRIKKRVAGVYEDDNE